MLPSHPQLWTFHLQSELARHEDSEGMSRTALRYNLHSGPPFPPVEELEKVASQGRHREIPASVTETNGRLRNMLHIDR